MCISCVDDDERCTSPELRKKGDNSGLDDAGSVDCGLRNTGSGGDSSWTLGMALREGCTWTSLTEETTWRKCAMNGGRRRRWTSGTAVRGLWTFSLAATPDLNLLVASRWPPDLEPRLPWSLHRRCYSRRLLRPPDRGREREREIGVYTDDGGSSGGSLEGGGFGTSTSEGEVHQHLEHVRDAQFRRGGRQPRVVHVGVAKDEDDRSSAPTRATASPNLDAPCHHQAVSLAISCSRFHGMHLLIVFSNPLDNPFTYSAHRRLVDSPPHHRSSCLRRNLVSSPDQ